MIQKKLQVLECEKIQDIEMAENRREYTQGVLNELIMNYEICWMKSVER